MFNIKRTLSTLLLIFMLISISGCSQKRIILVPQTEYYPTFDTSDFNASKKYHIDAWIETEDVNGTTKTYLVAEKKQAMGFIKDTKVLRSEYNTLLKEINKFNQRIKELNKIQSQKKPTEIESLDNSWFK
jgi:predicted small lipoprotein YifL